MTEEQFTIWIGKRLKELRSSAKMSQEEVASKAGCNRAFIAKAENGKKISTFRLKKILEAMDYTLNDIFSGVDEKKNSTLQFQGAI